MMWRRAGVEVMIGGNHEHPVPLEKLRADLGERGEAAYLLTVSDDIRPHVVHARVCWEGDALAVEVGKLSAANAAARPSVSLLFPA